MIPSRRLSLKKCIQLGLDYSDPENRKFYNVRKYFQDKELGIPSDGIQITNFFGDVIGIIKEEEIDSLEDDDYDV